MVNLKEVRGISVRIACEYCKEAGRVPGGKYKHEGEVIACPVCDGYKTESVIISMKQFRTLMTMTEKRVKPRSWSTKSKSLKKPNRAKNC